MTELTVSALLTRKRRRAAAVLWLERLAPAMAPALAIMLIFCALAWFGVLALLPASVGLALLLGAALTALALAAYRAARVRRPSLAQIDRRLERREPHHPLATLADVPAFAGAEPVWQAHRERALARIPHLSAGPPSLDRATGGILTATLALALTAAWFAGPAAPGRLWHALSPDLAGPPGPPARLQAWIVPPAAMALPPIFLRVGDAAPITAPPGAHLTVSLLGGQSAPNLLVGGQRQRFRRLDRTSFQADSTLTRSGPLEVWRRGQRLAGWRLTVAPDQPPVVSIDGAVSVRERSLSVPWRASDDYGLAAVVAELRLQGHTAAAPASVVMPLPGLPKSAQGARLPDLTAHPWAGLPVTLHYVARDSGGQLARSAEVTAVLPERVFLNPVARALIGIRRGLSIATVGDPAGVASAVQALDRLSEQTAPQLPLNQWFNLRAISALMARQPGAVPEAQARLWQLAIQIEDAGVADAKQLLADARNALSEALAAPTSPAQQQKIAALTQALQQALQQYLQAMNRQAAQSGQAPPEQAGGRSVDAAQLQQMEKALADAARAGRTAEAQQRLAELGKILDSLRQSTKTAGAAKPGQAGDPAFAKLLQDQAGLRAHTDQRLSDNADPRTSAGPERDPDEAASQPDPDAQRKQDAQAQSALRQRLGALAQKLGDQTGTVPDGLAQADSAMREAQSALAQGDDKSAQAAQQRALDGLRSAGSQQPGAQAGAAPGPGTDPLGRPLDESGNGTDEATTNVPTEGDAARSRALRDELRRRAADRTRPPAELEYIERLLAE